MPTPVVPGADDVSVTIRILDSTTFLPEEGVTSASAGLALWYRKGATGAVTAITESDLSAATDAHTDGGLIHLDDGWYRVDLVDSAIPTSEGEVTIVGGAVTDMIVLGAALVGRTTPNATAPLDAAGIRNAVGLAAADLDTQLGTLAVPGDAMALEAGAIQAATFAAGAIDAAAIAPDAIGASEIAADALAASEIAASAATEIAAAVGSVPTATEIADTVLRRSWQSAADSATGDALSFRSLLGAIAKLVNKVAISGSTLTVYEADDVTSLGTQALTTDPDADPITGADTT